MVCYAGHYELKDGEVHHHVEMALNPNMVGQTMSAGCISTAPT